MHSLHASSRTRSALAAMAICCTAAGLASCGGGEPVAASQLEPIRPAAAPPAVAELPAGDPAAMPADPAAQTRRGLYLRLAAAEAAEVQLGGDVIWVVVECCGNAAEELATLTAFGMQAAKNLGSEAPFFVQGADLPAAARLANRLQTLGLGNAYLVTP